MNFDDAVITESTIQGVPPLSFMSNRSGKISNYKIYGNSKQQLLPDEYQQVEYIESTGEQYINTKIAFNTIGSKLGFDIDILFKNNPTGNQYFIGSSTDGGRYCNLRINNDGTFTAVTGGNSADTILSSLPLLTNQKNTIKLSVNNKIFNVYLNDINYTDSTESNVSSTSNICLFGLSSNPELNFIGRIYKFRLYDGDDILIRNLIPCYRKSDNVIGMYDLANSRKNLYDESRMELGSYDQSTGEPISGIGNQCRSAYSISCVAGDKFIQSNTSYNLRVFWYSSIGTFLGTDTFEAGRVVTAPTNAAYMKFITGTAGKSQPYLIERGTTATSYESYPFYTNAGTGTFTVGPKAPTPEIPIPIESVGDKSKNLFNINKYKVSPQQVSFTPETSLLSVFENDYYIQKFAVSGYGNVVEPDVSIVNGVVTVEESHANWYGTGFPFKVDAGKTYVVSFNTISSSESIFCRKAFYDANGIRISSSDATAVTIPSGCEWMVIGFICTNIGSNYSINNIQVEEASSATAYEPYGYRIPISVSKLPIGYQEVEYLQSNGNQYIDINYTYKINDEIECDFSKDEDSGDIQGVFGNGNLGPYIGAVLYIDTRNLLTITIGGILGKNFFKWENNPITLGQKYTAKITRNKLYIDGNLAITVTNTLQDGTQSDFSLFRRWNTLELHGKIYKMSIKRNGEYLFNFIPCYRKADNVIGMYDIVNGVFYTNSGTGTFIKGPEVVFANIYLNEPLRKINNYADYIDYKNKKVVRNVGVYKMNSYQWTSSADSYLNGQFWVNTHLDDFVYPATQADYSDIMFEYYRTAKYSDYTSADNIIYSADSTRLVYIRDLSYSSYPTLQDAKDAVNEFMKNKVLYYAKSTPTEETINLPELTYNKGNNIFDVYTNVKPSNLILQKYAVQRFVSVTEV